MMFKYSCKAAAGKEGPGLLTPFLVMLEGKEPDLEHPKDAEVLRCSKTKAVNQYSQ